MIDNDDCTFPVVYSLLKIRVKHIYLKISLKFLEVCSKLVFAWVQGFFSGFILIVLNFSSGRKNQVGKKVLNADVSQKDSIMCGYFCIEFIDFMLKGKSLLDYTNSFSPNDYEKND